MSALSKVSGIYIFQSTENNEAYIGQTVDFEERFGQHYEAAYCFKKKKTGPYQLLKKHTLSSEKTFIRYITLAELKTDYYMSIYNNFSKNWKPQKNLDEDAMILDFWEVIFCIAALRRGYNIKNDTLGAQNIYKFVVDEEVVKKEVEKHFKDKETLDWVLNIVKKSSASMGSFSTKDIKTVGKIINEIQTNTYMLLKTLRDEMFNNKNNKFVKRYEEIVKDLISQGFQGNEVLINKTIKQLEEEFLQNNEEKIEVLNTIFDIKIYDTKASHLREEVTEYYKEFKKKIIGRLDSTIKATIELVFHNANDKKVLLKNVKKLFPKVKQPNIEAKDIPLDDNHWLKQFEKKDIWNKAKKIDWESESDLSFMLKNKLYNSYAKVRKQMMPNKKGRQYVSFRHEMEKIYSSTLDKSCEIVERFDDFFREIEAVSSGKTGWFLNTVNRQGVRKKQGFVNLEMRKDDEKADNGIIYHFRPLAWEKIENLYEKKFSVKDLTIW